MEGLPRSVETRSEQQHRQAGDDLPQRPRVRMLRFLTTPSQCCSVCTLQDDNILSRAARGPRWPRSGIIIRVSQRSKWPNKGEVLGGLAAAKALRNVPVQVILVDRTKGFAALQSGTVRISRVLAWLVWAVVHLEFLAQSSLRVSVFVQWVWTYITGQRGSRLIVNHHGSERSKATTSVGPELTACSK